MGYLIIEWMDGRKGYLFLGVDTRTISDPNWLIVSGGDGSYKQRGKVHRFPKNNIRMTYNTQKCPDGIQRIPDGED